MLDTLLQWYDYYFKEDMAKDILMGKYGTNPKKKELYSNHSYSILPEYRKIKGENIRVDEFPRYIQITYKFSPLFQDMVIVSNKDNHLLNRVYIKADHAPIGPYFHISDDNVFKLLQLPASLISQFEEHSKWYTEATERIEEFRPEITKCIEQLPYSLDFNRTLFATSKDFLLHTSKGPKSKDYHIPVTDNYSAIQNMFNEVQDFYREKEK